MCGRLPDAAQSSSLIGVVAVRAQAIVLAFFHKHSKLPWHDRFSWQTGPIWKPNSACSTALRISMSVFNTKLTPLSTDGEERTL